MSHDHHDMPGHDMPMAECAMHMLWNTQIIDTCIVFPQWHVRSHFGFFVSFLVIVGLGVAYEWLRQFQRNVDLQIAQSLLSKGKGPVSLEPDSPSEPLEVGVHESDRVVLTGGYLSKALSRNTVGALIPTHLRLLRATIYATTVFLSFFLMLVFMTYNAYLTFAVVIGAATGHFIFSGQMDPNTVLNGAEASKGMACH